MSALSNGSYPLNWSTFISLAFTEDRRRKDVRQGWQVEDLEVWKEGMQLGGWMFGVWE